MSNLTAVNYKGVMGGKVNLDKNLFGSPASPILLAQAVRVWLGNQRKSSAKTKTRGDVAKTTAKMFKQKGTGNARHGSYAAPIFVGGGVAHGPSGTQNYKRTMSRAQLARAMTGALTDKAQMKKLWVMEEADKFSGKTKEAVEFLDKAKPEVKSCLIVVTPGQRGPARAFGNLPKFEVVETARLHPFHIISHDGLILTREAVDALEKTYSK